MKFLSFHLMAYNDLPKDFKKKYDSICVSIDSKLIDSYKVYQLYNEYLDQLEYASVQGFDGICVNEHHASAYGLVPSPNLMASSLARRTKNTAICVLGNSIALYNPPTRVAEELAMVDCLSEGRLIAGFPVGTPMDTAYAYSQNPSLLRSRYKEAHDIILRSWTNNEIFSINGQFNKLRYVNVIPRPLQRPHPPIWIPGGGSIETWQWCAKMDYVYCHVSYYGHKAAEETLYGFWKEMSRLKKDRNPYRAAFLQIVGVAETEKEAYELYRDAGEYLYQNCLHIDSRYVGPPGYASEATVRAKYKSKLTKAGMSKGAEGIGGVSRDWQGIIDNGYVLIGTPDQVASKLRKMAVEFNVGHLMVLSQFGNMSNQLAKYNIDLFTKKVIPQIKDVFENEWEDHWWPQKTHIKKIDKKEKAA